MNRSEKIFRYINPNGHGLEIGPSFRPMAPKRDGYRVHILDHLNREQLIAKYMGHNVPLENIEEVDFVWNGEDYAELTGQGKYYDWIIASHLIEHTPDLIGFLNNCDAVLKDDGVISLVIPDKRYCFDHYRPITGLSRIVDSYFHKNRIHTPGTVAEYYLDRTSKGGEIAWYPNAAGPYEFFYSISDALQGIDLVLKTNAYLDVHAWCFVPHSFRLIIHDLYELGLIQLREVDFFPTEGCEFFITLSRNGKGINRSRLEMLDIIESEVKDESSISTEAANQITNLTALLAEKDAQLSAIYNSFSWKIIQPLRRMLELSRGTWLERLWFFVRSKIRVL